jgi:hypothetical protein
MVLLADRYSPGDHVDVSLKRSIDALLRNENYLAGIDDFIDRLKAARSFVIENQRAVITPELLNAFNSIAVHFENLVKVVEEIDWKSPGAITVPDWGVICRDLDPAGEVLRTGGPLTIITTTTRRH